jgi:MFS family permease
MRSYLRGIAGFPRDIKLFMAYQLLANLGYAVFALIFNLYLLELNLREDYIGAFNGVQTVAMGISGILIGRFVGRFGTWRCLAGGVAALIATSYLLAFGEQPAMLLLLSGLFGFSLSYIFSLTMPFVLEFAPPADRPMIASVAFSIQSLSTTFGSLVGGFLPVIIRGLLHPDSDVGLSDYRWTLLIGTTIALTGLIPLFRMREARHSTEAQDLARAPIEESPIDQKQARSDLRVFVALAAILGLGVGMVMPFYNVFLNGLGADTRQVGYVFALGSGVAALFGLAAPWVNRKLGTMDAMLVLRLSTIPLFLALIVAPGYGLAIAAHVVRTTSISMTWPIDSTFTGEILPPRMRSTVFGLRSASWNLASAVAAVAGGWIIVNRGYGPTFAAMGFFTVLSVAVFAIHFRRHPRVRAGDIPNVRRQRRAVT